MAQYNGGNDSVVANLFQPLIGILQQNEQLQQQRAQEQRKQAQKIQDKVEEDFISINGTGLRDADVKDFNKSYNNVKDLYYKMYQTDDPTEKRKYAMQVRQGIYETKGLVDASVKQKEAEAQADSDTSSLVGKGYPDKWRSHISNVRKTPVRAIQGNWRDKSAFMIPWSQEKVNTRLGQINNTLLKSTTATTTSPTVLSTRVDGAGNRYEQVETVTNVPDEEIFKALSSEYQSNPNFTTMIDTRMEEAGITDLNQGIAMVAEEFKNQGYFSQVDRKENRANERRTPVYNINLPDTSDKDANETFERKVGDYYFKKAKTYKETVPLIGEVELYGLNGGKATVDWSGNSQATFQGSIIDELPVDANGEPVPVHTSGSKKGEAIDQSIVAGYRNFLVGTASKDADMANLKDLAGRALPEGISNGRFMIPMSNISYIQKGKAQRAELNDIQNSTRNKPNNSVSSEREDLTGELGW